MSFLVLLNRIVLLRLGGTAFDDHIRKISPEFASIFSQLTDTRTNKNR
jgi:hypothetical protein